MAGVTGARSRSPAQAQRSRACEEAAGEGQRTRQYVRGNAAKARA